MPLSETIWDGWAAAEGVKIKRIEEGVRIRLEKLISENNGIISACGNGIKIFE